MPVNWCPELGTVLANEEVIDGRSERGGFPVELRPMRQWMLRITAYADRLLADLDTLQWPRIAQGNAAQLDRQERGAEIDFQVAPPDETRQLQPMRPEARSPAMPDDLTITVFTTRPDTLYGVTYMVLAPEHPLVDRITPDAHRETIEAYRTTRRRKERTGSADRDRRKRPAFSPALLPSIH